MNEQGNGNASFEQAGRSAGVWHVVLTTPLLDPAVPAALQAYASAPVTLR